MAFLHIPTLWSKIGGLWISKEVLLEDSVASFGMSKMMKLPVEST